MKISLKMTSNLLAKYCTHVRIIIFCSTVISYTNAHHNPHNPLTMISSYNGQILFSRHTNTYSFLGQARGTGIPERIFYRYDAIINIAADYYKIDPLFIKAILIVESGLNMNAISKANARGIAQFMRTTADIMGVGNRHDPETAIWGCAALLRRHSDLFNGNMILMAAAYNAGPKAIKHGRIPHLRETENYVPKVLWTWEQMHRYHQ